METVNTLEIFSTPMWESSLPNFQEHKESLVNFLREQRKNDPVGVTKTNLNGYQTGDQTNNNIITSEEFRPLFNHVMNVMMKTIIEDCKLAVSAGHILSCWANFNDKAQASNQIHAHDGVFSGVFYLNAPKGSGDIVFINEGLNPLWVGLQMSDTRGANKYMTPYKHIVPEEGKIYIWNSALLHYVNPNAEDVERISMSFNIGLTPVTPNK